MRRMLSAALCVALVVAAAASSAAHPRQRCVPAYGTRTLARNHYFRAYADDHALTSYLCDRRTGRRWALGDEYAAETGSAAVAPVALAGTTVAWQQTTTDDGSGNAQQSSQVSVRELGHRARVHHLREHGFATRLVVNRRGSIAWVERRASDPAMAHFHVLVRRIDTRGSVVLDEGDDEHAPRHLTLRGGLLNWEHDGATLSATLR